MKAKAEQRLRQMVDPMIDRLYTLATQTDNLKVASECVRDALDRAGIGALVEAKVRSAHAKHDHGSGVTVNIGFLSQPPIEPDTQRRLGTGGRDADIPLVMPSLPQVVIADDE